MHANCYLVTTGAFGHFAEGARLTRECENAYANRASVQQVPLASCKKGQLSSMAQSPTRLSDLWSQRGFLSENDKWELYQRIVALLLPAAASLCSGLSIDSPEGFVRNFAQDNVTDLGSKKKSAFQIVGENETMAYIRRRFEMYVSDIRRMPDNARKSPPPDEGELDLIDTRPTPPPSDGGSTVEILASAGIELVAAVDHASQFVGALHRDEKIFLFHNTCMDYDDKQAEREHGKAAVPLIALARQFAIKNYYRKARELGITGLQGGSVKDFAKSKLGRWMRQIGLRVDEDHWDEMKAMLFILCGVIFDSGAPE